MTNRKRSTLNNRLFTSSPTFLTQFFLLLLLPDNKVGPLSLFAMNKT
jgi:hypothetical protein